MTSETLAPRWPSSLPFTLPVVDVTRGERPRTPAGIVTGLLLFAAAIWLVVQNDMFRAFEARAVTPIAGFVIGGQVVRVHDIVYFGLGTSSRFGLHLTDECTSALLLIPLLVMMGFIAIFTRLSLRRQLLAMLAGALLIVAVNIGRMVGIAYATSQWGFNPGYEYSHVFIGSAFSLVGFVGAVLLALWILVRAVRTTPTPFAADGGTSMVPQTSAQVGRARRVRSRRGTTDDMPPELVQDAAAAPDIDTTAAEKDAAAARAELGDLRDRFVHELAHLRDRFDHHLVAAQQGERTALDHCAELEVALAQADAQRLEYEEKSREAATRAAEAEARLAATATAAATAAATAPGDRRSTAGPGAGTASTGPDEGRHAATPSREDLRTLLADVQSRIESLSERIPL